MARPPFSPLAPRAPLAPFASHCSLFTYLAPSSCDRNRPPPSQVDCKLTLFAPPFSPIVPPLPFPRDPNCSAPDNDDLGTNPLFYTEHLLSLRCLRFCLFLFTGEKRLTFHFHYAESFLLICTVKFSGYKKMFVFQFLTSEYLLQYIHISTYVQYSKYMAFKNCTYVFINTMHCSVNPYCSRPWEAGIITSSSQGTQLTWVTGNLEREGNGEGLRKGRSVYE